MTHLIAEDGYFYCKDDTLLKEMFISDDEVSQWRLVTYKEADTILDNLMNVKDNEEN